MTRLVKCKIRQKLYIIYLYMNTDLMIYLSITSVDVGNTIPASWWARASFAQKTMVFSAIGIASILTVFIIACLIAQKIRIGFNFSSPLFGLCLKSIFKLILTF